MTKEALTTENIKKDLRKYFFWQLRHALLTLLLIVPLAYPAVMLIVVYLLGYSHKIALAIYFTPMVILVSYDVLMFLIGLCKTKKGNFTITTDWVVEKKNKVYGSLINSAKPYRLIFAKSGTYNMLLREYYAWSDLHATTPKMICELTDINDEFYVINVGSQKTLVAYRKKHFELEEQSSVTS